ncbi:NAD(P)-dependent oxidoreductase [Geobacillus thermocatenulatus]|uniref:NAD(P)-dependent oxidoreductase n=1 Tax=Geobacillus thermocatenulatus TaxID=33938 RepID=A0A226Q4V6_9BACL|nr:MULTISPECIES: SDR family oxidoreductase [Geobacillus]AST00638.1 NAD(P)-dependent oxidoreductase [Geobacillus thermocatenulatus]KLR75130.1 NmrA family protein [Geobacillus sp. T6]OXB87018.1 NAD(P)-dependent oxidoreductase [Geobacillus thermocatenulatus]RAN30491.1 NmrA family protein [Geobacillus sp. A8]
MKILVTGATGKLGTKVVETLLKSVPASELAVSVRQPEKAEHFRAQGIDVRYGDFDRPETLDTAFQGIDRLLIISTDGDNETRIRQHTNAVKAAQRAQVRFIAYTSLANASKSRLALAEVHRVTEEAIANTGIPYSFLRNNWYLENELGTIQAVLTGSPWVTSAGTGKVGWALRQDYAEAAAAVLAGDGHENTIYELSGPLMTQEELASALGGVLCQEVPMQQVDDAAYADIMRKAGLPDPLVSFLVDIQRGIREGSLEVESNDLEKLLGRPVTRIHEALTQLVRDIKRTTH